ncbi:MAG: glycosyltransferase family 39 protein, partial [Patescibacteria group bacterium]
MKRFSLYLSLITLLGLIPRIILLVRRGSFWFDEIFTLELAKLPFGEMLALASRDTNPPLWTILMWPWVHLLPHAEWIVRIPALLLGILLIPLIGLLGRALLNDRTGLIAAFFVALSPPLIYFSTEARMYALFITLTVAAALAASYV